MIWYALLSLHFFIVVFGVFSHLIFLQLFVFRGMMDIYGRINLGLMSISMLLMLVTYFAEIITCLSIGSALEDEECSKLDTKFYLTCIHRFNEMISLITQLFFTIERVLTIQFSRIHQSEAFQVGFIFAVVFEVCFSIFYMYTQMFHAIATGFIWYIVLQAIIIANFPFVFYAKRKSMSKFTATVTTYSLRRKHNLFNYYETARSFIFSTSIYLLSQLTVFTLVWLYFVKVLFPDELPKLLSINNLVWNWNLAAFPWIVILFHRSQRERIHKIWSQIFSEKTEHRQEQLPSTILGVTGKELVTTPTQTDYFDQLQKAWE